MKLRNVLLTILSTLLVGGTVYAITINLDADEAKLLLAGDVITKQNAEVITTQDYQNLGSSVMRDVVVENILSSGATSTEMTATGTPVTSNAIDVSAVSAAVINLKATASTTDSVIYYQWQNSSDNSNWYVVSTATSTGAAIKSSIDYSTSTFWVAADLASNRVNYWELTTTTAALKASFNVPDYVLNNRFLRIQFRKKFDNSKIWAEISKVYK